MASRIRPWHVSVTDDHSDEPHYVCALYPDCRDRPLPESKLRPNSLRTCRTHQLPITTVLPAKEG